MTNYYVRETPDGADVLNRISVTFSALVCTCYEVSTAQQIVNALNAQAPPAAVPEDAVTRLAVYLAEQDGHEPHHLLWEGNPPEPWGEVWNRYEPDARKMLVAALAERNKEGG